MSAGEDDAFQGKHHIDKHQSTHTLVLSADFSLTRSSRWRRHHFTRGPVSLLSPQIGESKPCSLTRLGVPELQVPIIGRAEELGACSVEADVSHSFTVT